MKDQKSVPTVLVDPEFRVGCATDVLIRSDFFQLLSLREFSVQGYYLILGTADCALFCKKDVPTNDRRALSLPGQTQNPNAYLPEMSLL